MTGKREAGSGKRHRVAVIGGDGIGPEVVDAALGPIEACAARHGFSLALERLPYGADHYLKTGETLPDDAFRRLRDDVDAIFVGALGDPRIPGNEHARDILLGLRFRLDLYINFRPVVLLHPDLTPLRADTRIGGWADGTTNRLSAHPPIRQSDHPPIDFVIFRENTEGLYLAQGRSKNVGAPDEEQIAEDVNTAPKVGRIIRAAFEWARTHGKTRVTMADKSNAIPAHRLWQRLFAEVGAAYQGITGEHYYIDALAMQLVKRPGQFQVIVTNNMFGDILSDLGAALVGGLGIAASANLHPGRPGLFEPVHGSAPRHAGKGDANPVAAILTGALMLEQLGHADAARDLERAVRETIAGGIRTPDIGGKATTTEVAAAITQAL
jgi:3-isopropylmalate dehydrogenase